MRRLSDRILFKLQSIKDLFFSRWLTCWARVYSRILPARYNPKGKAASLMKDRSEVLILCKGNICRSPYAQKRLQKLLSEQSIDIEVRSAGLETNNGKPADPSAVNQALLRGLDLSSHKTKPVTIEDIERASAIFVMTPDQKRQVLKRATITKDKTYLLGEFAVSKGYQVSIPDPFGKADILFENCFKHIDAALGEIVQELVQKRNEKPRE